MKNQKIKSSTLRTVFDIKKKKTRLKELEKEMQNPDFWKNKEKAVSVSQELNRLAQGISSFDELFQKANKVSDEKELSELERELKQKETETFFSGKYDSSEALLSIHAGAGGQDAQDWAAMLLRMYQRYAERKNFKSEILQQSFGEGGGPDGRIGIKSITMEIKGKLAFGFLKKENGVHRLVRISPFSAKKLRHTSFALVEVIPKIKNPSEENIVIKPEELRLDFYKASGPGGQYVNKRETAVRITHLPSGISASCQSERSQSQNRQRAMELIYSRLFDFYQKKHGKEVSDIKGKRTSASWGNQIRSYVLHPYKLVKDLRTDLESSQVEKVLDGYLDDFIEAEIKNKDD